MGSDLVVVNSARVSMGKQSDWDDGIQRRVAATDAARNAIVPQAAAEFVAAFMNADYMYGL